MNRVFILFLSLISLIFVISCSGYRKAVKIPESRQIAENYSTAPESAGQEYHPAEISSKRDTLLLVNAIQLALLKNPELQSYSLEIRAREARTLQESFVSNPELEFEIENFGGAGEYRGFNGSEITLSVGQIIELAGKRDKRTRAAAFRSDLAAWDYESKKLDIWVETVKRFIQLTGAQEQVRLNEELVSVSEKLHQAVNRLVQVGKISAAEISRSKVLLSKAKSELNKSERSLETNRFRLSSLWGETLPGFKIVTGSLDTMAEIPPVDSLKRFLSKNPDIVRWATEIEMRQEIESLEEAKKIPDPTIQAGYRHLTEPNVNAFMVNLSIPIPIFNNNKGAIQEAFNRRKKAEEQRRQTEIVISTNLIELYQNLLVLYAEIDNSKKIVIPESEKAYRIINEGYLSGKFSFLDVLESQRTLFEARKNMITSLMAYHIHVADVERLIGRSLATVSY
jgi:cobalt-zinc-cadmium efflux system outer membrane protein